MLKDTELRLQSSLQTLKQSHDAHCTDCTRQLVELNSQLRQLEDKQYWLQKELPLRSFAQAHDDIDAEVEQVKKWPSVQDRLQRQRLKFIAVLILFALVATVALLGLRSLVTHEFHSISQESMQVTGGIYSDL